MPSNTPSHLHCHTHSCNPTHPHTITLQLHTPSHSPPLWPHVLMTLPFCLSLAPGYWREESQNCPTAKVSTLIQCSSLSNLRQPDWQLLGSFPGHHTWNGIYPGNEANLKLYCMWMWIPVYESVCTFGKCLLKHTVSWNFRCSISWSLSSR